MLQRQWRYQTYSCSSACEGHGIISAISISISSDQNSNKHLSAFIMLLNIMIKQNYVQLIVIVPKIDWCSRFLSALIKVAADICQSQTLSHIPTFKIGKPLLKIQQTSSESAKPFIKPTFFNKQRKKQLKYCYLMGCESRRKNKKEKKLVLQNTPRYENLPIGCNLQQPCWPALGSIRRLLYGPETIQDPKTHMLKIKIKVLEKACIILIFFNASAYWCQ